VVELPTRVAPAVDTLVLGGCAAMRQVFSGSLVRLVTFRCFHEGSEMTAERWHPLPTLVVGFAGASVLTGARPLQLDPASAIWHGSRETYRVRHPWGCDCRGCYLVFEPEALAGLEGPRCDASSRQVAISPRSQLALRRLLAAARDGASLEPLAVEEEALRIAGELWPEPRAAAAPRRSSTSALHLACVARARAYLQQHFRERLRLQDVARAACASPDHLTRLFRRATQTTLHGYLMRLRLTAALDAVLDSDVDLTTLALDLGFASHSHLTLAFRRHFGVTPSAARGRPRRGGPPARPRRSNPTVS
jgi:AraC-like DNA-binding protein